MSDPDDRSRPNVPDEENVFAEDGRYPSGEGGSESPTGYEAIALRNDLARQLESVVAAARAWARADDEPESEAIAEALAELYDQVGEPIGS